MKTLRYSPILLLLISLLGLSAFALKESSVSHAERVRGLYLAGIDSFAQSVDTLSSALRDLSGSRQSIARARTAFYSARQAYKQIEFLVAYLDQLAAGKLNAPALPKVIDNDMQRTVLAPEGFQVIEEHLFGDDPASEKAALMALAERLPYRVRKMREFAASTPLEDRYVFEAMRKGILRVGVMGLTGFDSPVALNSIPEAEQSLLGIRGALAVYEADLTKRSRSLARQLDTTFSSAIYYLRAHRDFDSFDRMEFLKKYMNPLYDDMLAAHYALGYPTYAQASFYTRPVRYEAGNIFEPDAFDPFFYSPDPADAFNAKKAELGRVLFFDPVLSHDNRRACVSCHSPELAFTDGRAKSLDITALGELGRNAPTLVNAVFQSKFFWDGRTEHLEHQIEDVLLNHSEMQATFEAVIAKLQESPEYRTLFEEAYKGTTDTAITKFGITKGLASYIRTLVALDSPFDRYMRGQTEVIDPAVQRGFNLFMGKAKCGTCHFAPIFNGTVPPDYLETETEVLGVPATPDTLNPVLDSDAGRYSRYLDELYRRSFKTPTVRNAELTAPYMHNGVFQTLEEVVDFYDRGGGAGLGFDLPNQTLPSDRLNLTAAEKADLVTFMRSLTDTAGTTTRPGRLPSFPRKPELNGRQAEY